MIKCDRWGSQGYRIIGGLVFLRLVRFQASNREYISGHSARLVYLLVLTVLLIPTDRLIAPNGPRCILYWKLEISLIVETRARR